MIEINNKLLNDIKEYCSYNDIEDVSGYINRLLKKSFMEEKYGKKPDICNDIENKDLQQEQEKTVIQPFWDFVKNIEGDNLRIIMEIGREYSEKNKDPNEYIEEIKQEYKKETKKQLKQEKQVTNEVSNKLIEENKIDIVEETPKLVNKEVPKESNSINLETLNIKEETKQKTEEIEKPKKSNRRKLS